MKRLKGFTLVELVVVIMIIIVLATISVPLYRGYVEDAMLAEGYALLGTIREAQKAYFTKYGNFLYATQSSVGIDHYSNNEDVLGIDARGNRYFTAFAVNGYVNYGTGGYTKKSFLSLVLKPSRLQGPSSDTALALMYNISLGQKIINFPKDFDGSWLQ